MLCPKWLAIHAVTIGLVVLFVVLGIWQLHRAEGGNTASWGYALEWPSFALLVIGFWVKVVRDDVRHRLPVAPAPGDLEGDAAELAAYNQYVAQRARLRSTS